MSEPRRLPPDEAWDTVAEMAADEEARRLEGLTPEELDREVAAMGRDPAAERAKGAALAAKLLAQRAAREAAPKKRVASRSARPLWLLAAALAVGAALLVERRAIVAWIEGPQDRQITPLPEEPPSPTEVAAHLRKEAADACGAAMWGLCARKLDEAKERDPAGEDQPGTRALRAAIDESSYGPDRRLPPEKRPSP